MYVILALLAVIGIKPRPDQVRRPVARGAARGSAEPDDAPLEDRP